jgi:MFS family permease
MPTEMKNHKWMVLSNTTLGVLAATINASIVLISLPAIFRGIGLQPLDPGNTNILLWTIMGYMVVTSVLVVSFGRLGDMFGRARIYNLGFLIFTIASILLSFIPTNAIGGYYLVGMRVLQGVGGAMLTATSTAILIDVFPHKQRGLALGINIMAAIAGQFIGLVLGGLLADIDWRLVFYINIPVGLIGTIWAYISLRDVAVDRKPGKLDWWGNITFAVGLILVLTGINDGIQPYGHDLMAWGSPRVLGEIGTGLAFLIAFVFVELRAAAPMIDLKLFRIAPFTTGVLATLSGSVGRGGLQFMLIIWLQGIWLPLHGYSFESTPLWAGIFMLPLTVGVLLVGPVSGWLSDRADVPGADAAQCRFRLLDVCGAAVSQRRRLGPLCGAQRHADDECGARQRARPGFGYPCDRDECGCGAVDRGVLHADDHRPGAGAAELDAVGVDRAGFAA